MRFSKHRRTRLSQKMAGDLMARFRGCEPIEREDIWKLGEEVGYTLGSIEKGSKETKGGGRSRKGKAYLRGTRRGQAKHSLVEYIQEKTMVAEKICSKDG